ncbi:S-adenosyl-L-methionine-dependent methyltransferase [Lipomyces tetrasporus]|uniref:Arsenite methyltransferase n=1 Tax=Lipomyces tetrasporus TaxID=54092 RepID=A0AAD7QNK7_9ASCO|nr:S-adenosyl-L-methionine-dependent methyltransferase [Lipomyces tetrasporus]KAJ8098599.1 S-adenosyl-L-methionine-dependent methyltransferase [Lipomyces tetrasporus]
MDAVNAYRQVQEHYGQVATTNLPEGYQQKVAIEDLHSIPDSSNLGVSCGNPLAIANVDKGETLIDLGCGGGIDVLLAAAKVGPEGKANMLDLARRNADKAGVSNASFVEASITSIPLPTATADRIISNCVINLVPAADKPLIFHEMFRLFKPGGRIAISDIPAKKELPSEVRNDFSLYVGCIAGASPVHGYENDLDLYKVMWEAERADKPGQSSPQVSCSSCCGAQVGRSQVRPEPRSFQVYTIKPKVIA